MSLYKITEAIHGIIREIVRKIIIWYYKTHEFMAWVIPIDEKTDLHILREKYYDDRREYGTRIEYFNKREETNGQQTH